LQIATGANRTGVILAMNTFLITANIIFYGLAFYLTARKIRRDNYRMWMRIPAAFLSGYIFLVYSLVILGIIPDESVRYFMRWFQLVIAAYIILEAKHG